MLETQFMYWSHGLVSVFSDRDDRDPCDPDLRTCDLTPGHSDPGLSLCAL
jgi:hypothetical protein